MTEADFLILYKRTLAQVEDTVEAAIQDEDADMDYESGNDMLTLMFRNNSVAIISRQSAIAQLWLAARSGGFHFDFDTSREQWICTVNGQSLQQMLTTICQEQGGVTVNFSFER